ncbi:MAG TPA: MBL fold metallo-hydrolase [Candidatus Eisenbacteria bacterium]|nr:MBL fold metallo-hydrolase [Candidatus Eisenbacteria bacterium]
MQLTFLGGANTVTGSRFLLTTERARVLIDCGMFQGSPNESIRNRVPLGFDPTTLDAILLTHAHLDHCGLLPVAVREGFKGPIFLTSATAELATLVLLDSGRLHEEFAKRQDRWVARHPERAEAEGRQELADYQAALELARRAGEAPVVGGDTETSRVTGAAVPEAREPRDDEEDAAEFAASSEHVPTAIEAEPPFSGPDPEADLRGQPPELIVDLDSPLYTAADAANVPPLFRNVRYDREVAVAPGVSATFLDAGHILGSAIIRLRVREADRERVLVFSGDLGRPNTPIIRDPTVLTEADYVCVESTYGGREHEPSEEAIRILAETVRAVADAQGVLLVPSFAVGRTQEIVWQLDRLIDRGEIPLLQLYLDSPMASKASDIYRRHPEFYDEETRALLQAGGSPLDYPKQTITNDVKQSRAIAQAPRPYMIVASNGMLTGGRVVGHLRNLIGDPAATLLFVGYQGQGTLGAHLQAGAKQVKLDGQIRDVKCRVQSISGFSAHADESELLDWIANFGRGRQHGAPGFPRLVFLVHGDPDAQIALAPKVEGLGFRVKIPHWREQVTLD